MSLQNEVGKVLQLIGFTVGEERFAINISEVHEINRFEHINRIPDLPDPILGVIDLRGVVIPVINLAEKLGISSQGVTKDTRIINHG
ncbi:MAG: chemotaxis protein CheW [Nitrospirae bacterium]|nr:chemotaxis protein CheW [Nitrospirota bacterium]